MALPRWLKFVSPRVSPRRGWVAVLPAAALATGLAVAVPQAHAAQRQAPQQQADRQERDASRFLRFEAHDDGGGTLQTSIVRYERDDGARVDLIGVVHIADREYYDLLNERFAQYDALLYEMVKPEDVDMARRGGGGGGGMNLVSMLQQAMQQVLALEYQLNAIDYGQANFVHADLTLEEFTRLQNERGESLLNTMVRQMLDNMARPGGQQAQPQMTMGEILMALQAPDRSRQLKLLMGRELSRMEDLTKALEGPEGSVILTERNRRAVEVVDKRLQAGDTNLGVFYGAAHMPGIEEMLLERGFRQVGEPEFLVAWDMTLDGSGQRQMRQQTRQLIQEAAEPADVQVLREEIRALRDESRALREQVDNLRRQNAELARRNEELARQNRQNAGQ